MTRFIRRVGTLLTASIVNVLLIALEALGVAAHVGDVRSSEVVQAFSVNPTPNLTSRKLRLRLAD